MSKIKNLVLGIGIVIVFALVLWQGIETFYPSPEYCDIETPRQIVETQTQCESLNGSWTPNEVPSQCIKAPCPQGFCDFYSKCQKEYDSAKDAHAKTVFFIALIVGIIAIIIGYTILKIEPVGSALIGSGIWSIFWGTVVNWRNFANIGRFILLLITLVLLIWLAIKLNIKKR